MPLEKEQLNNFISVLDNLLASIIENANKLTNLEMKAQFKQASDSLWQEGNLALASPMALSVLENSLNEGDSSLLLMSTDLAALVADKMMGADVEELSFSEDKHEALTNLLLQSAHSAFEQVETIANANLKLTSSKMLLADPADAESLKMDLKQERSLFEFAIEVNGKTETLSLDLSHENISILLSLMADQDSQDTETVGDFMGTNFAEIVDQHNANDENSERNLNLLMDIRLGLIVELGRSEMHLRDILKLTKGSIVELDRFSGEPVDLFVNNKLIARGEVVVIDDSFGLRISQLAGSELTEKQLIGMQD